MHFLNKADIMEFADLDPAANEDCAEEASWSHVHDEYVPAIYFETQIIQDKNVA